ncbi:hypothetical protein MTO96_001751 [Rhipicephalus appendiculatus]
MVQVQTMANKEGDDKSRQKAPACCASSLHVDMSRPSGGGKSQIPMAVMIANRRGSDFRPHSSSCSGRLGEADRPRKQVRSRRSGSLSAIGQQQASDSLNTLMGGCMV